MNDIISPELFVRYLVGKSRGEKYHYFRKIYTPVHIFILEVSAPVPRKDLSELLATDDDAKKFLCESIAVVLLQGRTYIFYE